MFGPFILNTGDSWPTLGAAGKLGSLTQSDWGFNIKSISSTLHVEPGEKFFDIDSYTLVDKNNQSIDEAKIGDEINLVLGLKNPENKTRFVISVPIKIPKNLKLKKEIIPVNYVQATIFVESGNNYREKDENKLLNREPDTAEEFLQQLLVDEKSHDRLYIQIQLPPSDVQIVKASWPNFKNKKWQTIKDFEFLRARKSFERKVLVQEIVSPCKDYLLNAKIMINLKINVQENKSLKAN